MAQIPSGSIDVILTDPPYGMGADEFGDSGGLAAGAHGYNDSYENWLKIFMTTPKEFFRITKANAHAYIFCDIDRFCELRERMQMAGWNTFRTPLIWHKPNGMRAPWPDSGPQRKYEFILFAKKGDRKVLHLRGDVLEHQADNNLGHAAQKPVALFENLLRRSVFPGNRVIDPFAGTGTILPAAHNLRVFATAFEQDAASYGIMVNRLSELKG
jgi:DNA modification methylase